MPWKNGGGATTEVAVHPPGAGLDDFAWRVSMASIASDGPFSIFPEVDRTLTVLEGDGLRLTIGDVAPVDLRRGSAPLAFAADVPTCAALLGGAVIDLNVMTRRSAWRHAVTHLAVARPTRHSTGRGATAMTLIWLCHRGHVDISGTDAAVRLGPLDAWIVEQPSASVWHLVPEGAAELYVLEVERVPGTGDFVKLAHAATEIEK